MTMWSLWVVITLWVSTIGNDQLRSINVEFTFGTVGKFGKGGRRGSEAASDIGKSLRNWCEGKFGKGIAEFDGTTLGSCVRFILVAD